MKFFFIFSYSLSYHSKITFSKQIKEYRFNTVKYILILNLHILVLDNGYACNIKRCFFKQFPLMEKQMINHTKITKNVNLQ